MNIKTGIIVIIISSIALYISKILSKQLKLYGSGRSSALDFLQGRYALGFAAMVSFSALVSLVIMFLLDLSVAFFVAILVAFSMFGAAMLLLGHSRRIR